MKGREEVIAGNPIALTALRGAIAVAREDAPLRAVRVPLAVHHRRTVPTAIARVLVEDRADRARRLLDERGAG